ncbi:MAG: flagellar protein FlgN [Betaproteobacteria bacterium]|nr:flagellar protein FlgN [Betaproteobacteria bacterium]
MAATPGARSLEARQREIEQILELLEREQQELHEPDPVRLLALAEEKRERLARLRDSTRTQPDDAPPTLRARFADFARRAKILNSINGSLLDARRRAAGARLAALRGPSGQPTVYAAGGTLVAEPSRSGGTRA